MGERIPNWLKKRADLSPDRPALLFAEDTYTFSQVFTESLKLAGKFSGLGLKKDSRAALLLSNHPQSIFILFALQMSGVQAVILNNRLTAEELSWQLKIGRASCRERL